MAINLPNERGGSDPVFLDEIEFKKIFFILYNHKWRILIITLGTFILGLIYTLNITPRYLSSALIQVDSQLGSANNMQQMLGNMDNLFATSGQTSVADIQIALIKSTFILQSVIDKLKLNMHASTNYFPLFGAAIGRLPHTHKLAKPPLGLSRYGWGGEKIKLEQFDLADNFIGLKYALRADGENQYSLYSPEGSFILQGKVGELATSNKDGLPELKILISELKANRGTYFTLTHDYNDDVFKQIINNLSIIDLGAKDKTKTGVLQISFQDSHAAFIPQLLNTLIEYAIQKNIEKKSAEASKTLDFLNKQLPSVLKSLEIAETELNEYRAENGTIDITQEAKILLTKLSALEQSIAEVKLKKVEMLQELTLQHPFIISLAQKQLQLEKEVSQLEKKIESVPRTDQREMNLERNVKVKDQLYLLLLNKIQQLQVLKAGTLSDIRILSLATTPIIPQPTNKSFILCCSALLGFILALAVLFAQELFRLGIDNTELVEERLGIPTFGIIPHSKKQKLLNRSLRHKQDDSEPRLLAYDAPKDIAIEGIRSLRTMLQFSLGHTHNNIIAMLGASPNIGKSFVSMNLAQVLSDSGKNVLLIDCDMRKGRANKFLGKEKSPGFSELLTHANPIKDVLVNIGPGFDFIACGEYPLNPSELLMTEELTILLAQFSKEYDVIIIDTPPILAVTEGMIIAKHAAINLMVVGCDTNHLEELVFMVKKLRKNDIKIDGLVFNNKQENKPSYGQYNYYYAYEPENT